MLPGTQPTALLATSEAKLMLHEEQVKAEGRPPACWRLVSYSIVRLGASHGEVLPASCLDVQGLVWLILDLYYVIFGLHAGDT